MHTLEPRKVETGALRRWSQEALELTGRRIVLWLPMTMAFWFFCVALSPLFVYTGPLGIFVTGALGIAWGVGVAAYADRRLTRQTLFSRRYLRAYWQYLRRSLFDAVVRHWFVFVVGFVGSMIEVLLSQGTEASLSPTLPANLSAVVLLVVFFMSASALLLQNLLANSHGSTHIHRLLLTVLLGLTWDESGVLVNRGCTLNRTQLGKLSGIRLTIGLFAIVVLSVFVPLIGTPLAAFGLALFPFTSSLFYVSFRDIYLGVAENVPVRSEKRVGVSVPE